MNLFTAYVGHADLLLRTLVVQIPASCFRRPPDRPGTGHRAGRVGNQRGEGQVLLFHSMDGFSAPLRLDSEDSRPASPSLLQSPYLSARILLLHGEVHRDVLGSLGSHLAINLAHAAYA